MIEAIAPARDASARAEVISPELVLVSPDLRARAIELLPPIELDRLAPLRPLAAPAPPPRRRRWVWSALALPLLSFAACTVTVLALTLIADGLR